MRLGSWFTPAVATETATATAVLTAASTVAASRHGQQTKGVGVSCAGCMSGKLTEHCPATACAGEGNTVGPLIRMLLAITRSCTAGYSTHPARKNQAGWLAGLRLAAATQALRSYMRVPGCAPRVTVPVLQLGESARVYASFKFASPYLNKTQFICIQLRRHSPCVRMHDGSEKQCASWCAVATIFGKGTGAANKVYHADPQKVPHPPKRTATLSSAPLAAPPADEGKACGWNVSPTKGGQVSQAPPSL